MISLDYDALETIKKRILTILGAPSLGFVKTYRDRGQIPWEDPDTKVPLLPACVFLDGKEKPQESDLGWQGQSRRGQTPEVTIHFEPQIYIVLMPSLTPDNAGIGEQLSSFRLKIHVALTTDQELMMLLGANGGITYLGHETDMQEGGDLRGVMRLDYRFAYVFLTTTITT